MVSIKIKMVSKSVNWRSPLFFSHTCNCTRHLPARSPKPDGMNTRFSPKTWPPTRSWAQPFPIARALRHPQPTDLLPVCPPPPSPLNLRHCRRSPKLPPILPTAGQWVTLCWILSVVIVFGSKCAIEAVFENGCVDWLSLFVDFFVRVNTKCCYRICMELRDGLWISFFALSSYCVDTWKWRSIHCNCTIDWLLLLLFDGWL